MTELAPEGEQPEQVPVTPAPAVRDFFGHVVTYESDEAKDHWNDDIWRR